MKASQVAILSLLSLVLFATASSAANQLQFKNGVYNLTWKYLPASQEIEFEVRVKTTGYVALGLTKTNSGMRGIDLFVGAKSLGDSSVKDFYVNGKTTPTEDTQKDYTMISVTEANGITSVKCKRNLTTNDANDFQIQAGDKVYFAWAYHDSSDTLIYHGANRGYSQGMHELVPVPSNVSTPATTPSTPTVTPTMGPTSGQTVTPTMGPTSGQTVTPTTSATMAVHSIVLLVLAVLTAIVAA